MNALFMPKRNFLSYQLVTYALFIYADKCVNNIDIKSQIGIKRALQLISSSARQISSLFLRDFQQGKNAL